MSHEESRMWAVETALRHYSAPINEVVIPHMLKLADALCSYVQCGVLYGESVRGEGIEA